MIKVEKKKKLYIVSCLYCEKTILAFSADESDLIASAQFLQKQLEVGYLSEIQPGQVEQSPSFWCRCPR